MTVEQIREMVKQIIEQKIHKHWQHNGVPIAELHIEAQKSWDRLSQERQDRVLKVAGNYGISDPAELRLWRYLCQTNLFFLCKVLEKYKDVSSNTYPWLNPKTNLWEEHNTHEEICNEFFVRKNPTIKTFKEFALTYNGYKERLLLVPRGGFKSSIDMADCVQWVINYPEVTIMILTGVLDLAKDFVKETKDHFTLADGGTDTKNLFETKKPTKPRTLGDDHESMFQILFPEHCIPEDDGKTYEFKTPASPEVCTLFAAAIDQNLSGWHVGVMKLDDVVTNENSRTAERILNINKQVSINNAMLWPSGFHDKIGTWYDSNDTYGKDLKFIEKCEKSGEVVKKLVYLRAAWWMNEVARKAGKIESECTANDKILWFGEEGQLTYEFLRYKQMEDPEGFAIKYLNDPTQVNRIRFPRELLIRRTINTNQLPQQGMIVMTVDTAFSTKSWADYTVILISLIYGGRFYVLDMKRGRYNEFELPKMVAEAAYQWKPKRICIEDAGAMKYIQREVYREMERLQIRIPVELIPLGKGSKENSKNAQAGPVLRYLGDDRLCFANQCVGLEELYNELEKFGTAAATHDDIVDALALLIEQFAVYADMEARKMDTSPAFVSDIQARQMYDTVYGQEMFTRLYKQKSLAAAKEALENDPTLTMAQAARAAEQGNTPLASDYDPLSDLWS